MTRVRHDGGVSGVSNQPTISSASGIWTLKDAEKYQRSGQWPAFYGISDQYFQYNSVLIHADGTNGANNNVFVDSSVNSATITRTGSTTQGTFSPFSTTGWSNYFPTTSDYATAASNSGFGFSGAFTIELWAFFTTSAAGTVTGVTTAGGIALYENASSLLTANLFGTGDIFASTFNVANNLGKWLHIVLARSAGNAMNIWVNGTSYGTGTSATVFTAGAWSVTYTAGPKGYISNLRVTNTDVYGVGNSTITVPNSALISVTGTLLLTCQSNRFVDNSSSLNAITMTGSPLVQPVSPFSALGSWSSTTVGGSILTGITSSDGLTIPYSTSTSRFTGDFTVECWFYMNNTTGQQTLFTHRSNSYVPFLVWVASGTLTLYMSTTNASWDLVNAQSLGTVKAGQWYHYALVRSGSAIKSYLNGVVVGAGATSSATLDSSTLGFRVGSTTDATPAYFNGYISNVRMVNGTAVYTSAFTPPTAPSTAITNTTFLLNATNGGIIDSSQKVNLISYGSAAISTTQSKFGGTSVYFDGSTGYLSNPSSTAFTFGPGDFTVEYWVYYNAISGSSYQQICGGSSTSAGFSFGLSSTAKLYMTTFSVGYTSTGTTLVTGQWYHVAFVRKSGTVYFYLNGVLDYSVSAATTITETGFGIGGGKTGGIFSSCYVDELRVTQGYARYTSNFTPQTSAFLNN